MDRTPDKTIDKVFPHHGINAGTFLLAVAVILLLGIVIGFSFGAKKVIAPQKPLPPKEDTSPGVICSQDALACPDGSYVSRHGPNCEFDACPSIQSSEIKNWKMYFNRQYKFSLKYPPDWTYKVSNNETFDLILSLSPNTASVSNNGLLIRLQPQTSPNEFVLPGYIEAMQRQGKSGFGSKPFTLGGISTNKYFRYENNTPQTTIVIFKNNFVWNFDYTNNDLNGNNNPLFDQILSTFRFE